jgi:hypothetical protein
MEMESEQLEYTPTTFDLETQSKNLQILKTIIPYLSGERQKNFAVMVKCLELKNVIDMFHEPPPSMCMCSSVDPSEMTMQLFCDIKKFCTPTEQDSIDMLLTALQMFSSYDGLFHEPAAT